jgi:hypothetical protein
MVKVTREGKEFELQVQVINKRPDEAAQELLDLRDELDRVYEIVYSIYQSGDYSRETEQLLRTALKVNAIV